MRIACWTPEATNTHIGCVILAAFPQQQWLHERALMLRYTYIACRFITNKTLPVTDAKHRATSFCAIQYVNLNANKNLFTNISI
jgi:hypothetical protein